MNKMPILKDVGEGLTTMAFLCALGVALWTQSDWLWWGVFLTVFGGMLFTVYTLYMVVVVLATQKKLE